MMDVNLADILLCAASSIESSGQSTPDLNIDISISNEFLLLTVSMYSFVFQPKRSPCVVLLRDDQHLVGYSCCYTLHAPQAQSQAIGILN